MGSSVLYYGDRFTFPVMFAGGEITLADESVTGTPDGAAPISNVIDGNPDTVWRRTGTTLAVLRFKNSSNSPTGAAYEPYGHSFGDWMVSGILLQNLRVFNTTTGQRLNAINIEVEIASDAAFTTNVYKTQRSMHNGTGFPISLIIPIDKQGASYHTSATLSPLQWLTDMIHARVRIYAGGGGYTFELGRLGILQALPIDIAPDYALTLSDPSVTQRAYSRRLVVRARDRFRRIKARAVGLRAEDVFGTPLNASTVTGEGMWDYDDLPLYPNSQNLMRVAALSGVSRTVGLQLNRYPLLIDTQSAQAFSLTTVTKTRAPVASQAGTFVGTFASDAVFNCVDHTDAMRPVYTMDFEIEEDNTILNIQE